MSSTCRALPFTLTLTLALLALSSCGQPEEPNVPNDPAAAPPLACDPLALEPLAPEALQEDVAFLASDAQRGRYPGSAGDEAVRAFIEQRFACIGLTAPAGGYEQTFVSYAGTTANTVGYLAGNDAAVGDEIIVIGAHHDHLGEEAGAIMNGANDNASGVAALLAAAQTLADVGTARTVAFIAFGAEEHDGDCEGSEFYAAHAPAELPLDDVVQMINLDMVGTYDNTGVLTVYGAFDGGAARSHLIDVWNEFPTLALDVGAAAEEDASDFQAFCDNGIPYVYFETWDEDCYHSACDDADGLDYENMSLVASLAAELTRALADADDDLVARRDALGCGD